MSDPEIEAMSQVAMALDNLAEDARGRVLRWAADRYGATIATTTLVRDGQARMTGLEAVLEDKPSRVPEVRDASERSFEHFVDLFDAVDPKSDVDKALTGAYWLQVVSKQDSWQSLRVNNLLKDMGHGVANVTSALRTAQERKPALVRQVHKSGKSQQSWKTYKLTTSGVALMRRRLGMTQAVPTALQDHGDDGE
jgi:hypothetical protein